MGNERRDGKSGREAGARRDDAAMQRLWTVWLCAWRRLQLHCKCNMEECEYVASKWQASEILAVIVQ